MNYGLVLSNLDKLELIPTYRVINRYSSGNKKVNIILVNQANDFDVIEIKVSRNVNGMVLDGCDYSIITTTKRTWYTLWLGKKKVYDVLGNVDSDKILIINKPDKLSKKAIENIQKEWAILSELKYDSLGNIKEDKSL